jgi:hypothetical protein
LVLFRYWIDSFSEIVHWNQGTKHIEKAPNLENKTGL